MQSAEVICDSVSEQQKRLLTYKLKYPKFIHAEFMTHRVLSRNASSSRAIPVAKLINEALDDDTRATPIYWGKNQKGMQASEELTGEALYEAKATWGVAAAMSAQYARIMSSLGAHKQIVNRILEPYTHINVIASATEWDNFFGLRLHRDAQPEMRDLAIKMWEARKASKPTPMLPGDWHLPFIAFEDKIATLGMCDTVHHAEAMRRKISVARCARVSYESFETGKRSTIEEDLTLFDKLLHAQPLHASPAEHQATPDAYIEPNPSYPCDNEGWQSLSEHGNYVGWRQFRKLIIGEDVAPIPDEFLS